MLKKIVDTNIFIDRFAAPERFKDVFLSLGQMYLSSVVLMELRAGTRNEEWARTPTISDCLKSFLTQSRRDAGEIKIKKLNTDY